jgi:hypothetical protein
MAVVVSLPLLGASGMASAKIKAAKGCHKMHTCKGGGGSGTGGPSAPITVQIDPDPLVETAQSDVVATVQVESSPSFAGDVVDISSSQLLSACTGPAGFETLESVGPTLKLTLDDDGNATVYLFGQDCAPGPSLVEASLAASATFSVAVLSTQVAEAATLTVTNCNDSGAGSLRQAIASANAGDTVNFSLSPVCSTIVLTTTGITIAEDITIDGPGAGALAVSGTKAAAGSDFVISSGVANISGLTIEGGTGAFDGGGIENSATLNLSESTVTGNTATNGGAIENSGTLTLTGATLSGNSATYGGGVDNRGMLTVSNSTLSANNATDGGGIEVEGDSTLSLNASTLSANDANFGGGIENGGTATVANSTLSGNNATYGGALDSSGALTVTQCVRQPAGWHLWHGRTYLVQQWGHDHLRKFNL